MSRELKEKVARALAGAEWGDGIWDGPTLSLNEKKAYRELASAAIDIVLEEAAMVAEAEASVEGIAQRIAAAIRAMKGESGRLCDQ